MIIYIIYLSEMSVTDRSSPTPKYSWVQKSEPTVYSLCNDTEMEKKAANPHKTEAGENLPFLLLKKWLFIKVVVLDVISFNGCT